MSHCNICSLRKFYGIQQGRPGDHPVSCASLAFIDTTLTAEKIMPLLAILVTSGLRSLQQTILILMYIISFHLAITPCSFDNYPILSGFIRFMPLIGTSCMTGFTLAVDFESPGLAAASIVLGTLPLVTLVIDLESQCGERSEPVLPMQTQDIPGIPTVIGAADTTIKTESSPCA